MADTRPQLAVLTTTFPVDEHDGTPPFVFELCARLVPDFRLTVIAPNAPGARAGAWAGFTVLRYRYAPRALEQLTGEGGILGQLKAARWRYLLVPGLLLSQAWMLWRIRRRIDLIHAHWLFPQGLIGVLAGGGKPVVCTSHGADVFALRGLLWDAVRRQVARRAVALTAVGEPLQQTLQAIPGSAPVHRMPMGIDLHARFVPATVDAIDPGLLLFVGRLVPKKGVDRLIAALASLRQRVPELTLSIAGDGPERQRLQAQVQQLGLHDQVRFLGPVANADLPPLYQRAALVVLPFRTAADGDAEGLGLTLLEALACGCKLVVGESAAQDALVSQCPGLWRCDVELENALSARIDEALSRPADPRQLRSLREPRLAPFAWPAVAAAYSRLLRASLDGQTRDGGTIG